MKTTTWEMVEAFSSGKTQWVSSTCCGFVNGRRPGRTTENILWKMMPLVVWVRNDEEQEDSEVRI